MGFLTIFWPIQIIKGDFSYKKGKKSSSTSKHYICSLIIYDLYFHFILHYIKIHRERYLLEITLRNCQ